MRTIEGYFRRYANALAEFVRFGLVGGLGVLVNMMVFVGISVLCRTSRPENGRGFHNTERLYI